VGCLYQQPLSYVESDVARVAHRPVAARNEDEVSGAHVGEAGHGCTGVLLVAGDAGQAEAADAVGLLDEAYLEPVPGCLPRLPWPRSGLGDPLWSWLSPASSVMLTRWRSYAGAKGVAVGDSGGVLDGVG
jgi:hypothetical protein